MICPKCGSDKAVERPKNMRRWGGGIFCPTCGVVEMRTCPHCLKDYEVDAPNQTAELEPWQRQQHQYPPYCSDKCFDEAISGERPEYTYDEKGRRFEDGVRKLFAAPARESEPWDEEMIVDA